MYWNNGQVIGGTTGAGFYEPEPIEGIGALGLGAIYAGVYNADVEQAQQMCNDLAAMLNYEQMGEDGKLGPQTCGFLLYFTSTIDPAELQISAQIAGAYNNLLMYLQSVPEIFSACNAQVPKSQWKTPTRVGPLPQPEPTQADLCAQKQAAEGDVATCQDPACYALNPDNCADLLAQYEQQQALQMQNDLCAAKLAADGPVATCNIAGCYALNPQECDEVLAAAAAPPPPQYTQQQIEYLCMAKIAQDGTLAACDVPECYAMNPSGCDELRAEAPRCFTLMGEQGVAGACADPKCYLLNPAGCDALAAEEPTYTFEEPEIVAPTGACEFNYGDSHPQIALLQQQLNLALTAGGYNQIPVTGIYDAATCGAIFELRGSFDPSPSTLCPQGWNVPFSCAQSTPPTRPAQAPPPLVKQPEPEPTKKKISTAAMLGIGGLLAAAVGGGVYLAKMKGAT